MIVPKPDAWVKASPDRCPPTAVELLENSGVDLGQAGKSSVRFSDASSKEYIREAARRLGEYLGRRG
jgi:hypothetical protein